MCLIHAGRDSPSGRQPFVGYFLCEAIDRKWGRGTGMARRDVREIINRPREYEDLKSASCPAMPTQPYPAIGM